MGGAVDMGAARDGRRGVGFTSGPRTHKTGKTIGGESDFKKRRLKVGKKVRKHASETDATIRAKSLRLTTQNVRTVDAGGDAVVSSRGTPLNELLNQSEHYASRTRAEALRGISEIAKKAPRAIRERASDVIERVGERLADLDAECRKEARECLRGGVAPALGERGLAPFARTLILYAGTALTHVQDGVRRDAPAALDALLDAAPTLVVAHAPASTLGHLGELLRRGDDGGVGSGTSTRRGVGSQKPKARLALLRSCRTFLEILVDSNRASSSRAESSADSTTSTFVWGESTVHGSATRSIGPLHAERARRAPASMFAAQASATAGETMETPGDVSGEGPLAVRANARRIVDLTMCVWDDASQTLSDERGVDIERVRVMTESMACARLALKLADDTSTAIEFGDSDRASAAVDIMPEIARRTLCAFPSIAPVSVVEKQDPARVNDALVILNFETCRFLVAASMTVANVALVRHLAPGTMEALPHVLARALQYVTHALHGVVLDGGAVGEGVQTPEEAYEDVMILARDALALPTWCFSASTTGTACAELVSAVTTTWDAAVANEDAERIVQCVSLLTATLPEEARQGYTRIPIEAVAGWVRHIPRVLWFFKHENPTETESLLSLLHDIAARNPPGSPLADVLSMCETEIAVLFFMMPPAGSPEGAKSRPGPFARLPFPLQCSAVRLLGVLPTLTAPTVRALAKICLDVDRVNEELSVIAVEALQTNPIAAPFELVVSFYATLLVGASGVKFLEKSSKRSVEEVEQKSWLVSRRVSPVAAAALVSLSDADAPWTGASLACATLRAVWKNRVEKGDIDGATRTAGGFVSLFASSAELADSVGVNALDDDDLASSTPDMFAWFILRGKSDHGVNVDVAWRALRLTSTRALLGSIANAVASMSSSSASLCDNATSFMTRLLRSDFIRTSGCEKGLRDAARSIQASSSALGGAGLAQKVRELDAAVQVAFDAAA